ncbi:hypothetical protein CAPTEDRAFT_188217 [Capitella teleta]|uniref:Uncharacterized protein n=1 Tax=Capitella teleta TaxID=283909 RepID=R7T887_CAPTE|nr:hypothetical protein CAPTEDRAFT_188217 [Capitella teleta]|eukprot:ELT89825.1 hypothetical protein CAPTEDRAFT_188217 [Capitella teleta]
MTSLRELRMVDPDCVPYNSLPMHPILPGIQHLNLRFIILRLHLRDDDLIALSNAMSSWPNLQELIIYLATLLNIPSGDKRPLRSHVSETTIQRLFRAIARCQNLMELDLFEIQIQDSLVNDLCKMVDSLGQLNEFSLLYSYDDTLTKDGIDKLEAYLMQKQDEMIVMYASKRLPEDQ